MRTQEEWLSTKLASIVERQENECDQIQCPKAYQYISTFTNGYSKQCNDAVPRERPV